MRDLARVKMRYLLNVVVVTLEKYEKSMTVGNSRIKNLLYFYCSRNVQIISLNINPASQIARLSVRICAGNLAGCKDEK